MEYIESLLGKGEINAIKTDILMTLTRFSNVRELRLQVERERKNGVLILSSGKGYYLPSDDKETALSEIQAFVKSADSRLVTNRESVHYAKEYLKLHSANINQESLFS